MGLLDLLLSSDVFLDRLRSRDRERFFLRERLRRSDLERRFLRCSDLDCFRRGDREPREPDRLLEIERLRWPERFLFCERELLLSRDRERFRSRAEFLLMPREFDRRRPRERTLLRPRERDHFLPCERERLLPWIFDRRLTCDRDRLRGRVPARRRRCARVRLRRRERDRLRRTDRDRLRPRDLELFRLRDLELSDLNLDLLSLPSLSLDRLLDFVVLADPSFDKTLWLSSTIAVTLVTAVVIDSFSLSSSCEFSVSRGLDSLSAI